MGLDLYVFWIFAPISVATAILMLVQRNAVHAALFLIANFLCIAVMYLVLGAELLFVVQIAVYAGAIMVLFLFVINLLGVDQELSLSEQIRMQRPLAIGAAIAITAEVTLAVRAGIGFAAKAPGGFADVNEGGNAQALGTVLFRDYFLPFEITSILLTVAAIAAVVLAQRRRAPLTDAEREEAEAGSAARPAARPAAEVEAGLADTAAGGGTGA